jgi:hypothetical protein
MPMLRQSLQSASPHEILQAWQNGDITYRDAMHLTASENLFELFQACRSSGVALRKKYSKHELEVVDHVIADLVG